MGGGKKGQGSKQHSLTPRITYPSHRSDDPEEDDRLKRTLATSVKDLAENSMIVDLVTSDFHRCAENVEVTSLHKIESYETVHQLVSTVEGDAEEFKDVLKCCFPGGSMTGAPKRRSMEIIRRLEQRDRGVYAGCVGFISYSGDAKLAMTIRTAVFEDGVGKVGAGGAITGLSEVEEEVRLCEEQSYGALVVALLTALSLRTSQWREVELKGGRVKRAIELAWSGVEKDRARGRKRDKVKSLVGALLSSVVPVRR